MRLGILKSSVLPAALLVIFAGTALAANPPAPPSNQTKSGTRAAKSVAPGQLKKFHVTAFEGKIAPNTLRVNQGDRVQITFVSRDGNYGIKFKDFDLKGKVAPDKPAVIEFVPNQKGTFQFGCSKLFGFKQRENGTLVVN
jgi:heme/copper-type cytochrome/quinol oxidase subunit 2